LCIADEDAVYTDDLIRSSIIAISGGNGDSPSRPERGPEPRIRRDPRGYLKVAR
jgi:hypothetical protein